MHGLVNVVFVGALIFYIVRQIGRRRSINPAPLPEARSTIAAEPAGLYQPPAPTQRKLPAPVQRSVPPATSSGGTRYILDGRHDGKRHDRTKDMLEMMSGPGICTPVDR